MQRLSVFIDSFCSDVHAGSNYIFDDNLGRKLLDLLMFELLRYSFFLNFTAALDLWPLYSNIYAKILFSFPFI